jgi:hypothetical protein
VLPPRQSVAFSFGIPCADFAPGTCSLSLAAPGPVRSVCAAVAGGGLGVCTHERGVPRFQFLPPPELCLLLLGQLPPKRVGFARVESFAADQDSELQLRSSLLRVKTD